MKLIYYHKDEKTNYVESLPDYGESVTDINSYHPNISNVNSRVETGASMTPQYAFPDGVDTGERVPYMDLRSMDITEVETMEKAFEKRVNEQIERGEKAASSFIDSIKRDVLVQQSVSPVKTE